MNKIVLFLEKEKKPKSPYKSHFARNFAEPMDQIIYIQETVVACHGLSDMLWRRKRKSEKKKLEKNKKGDRHSITEEKNCLLIYFF